MFKRFPLVLSMGLAFLVFATVAAAGDVDPQALPGVYKGDFTASFLPAGSRGDRATVTIKEVNGNVVTGAVYLASNFINPALNNDLPFTGTLDGNRISVKWPASVMTMTVDGKSITGKIEGRYTTNFQVEKK